MDNKKDETQIIEELKELNSLPLNELDEEIGKMQMTYSEWCQLMNRTDYWQTSLDPSEKEKNDKVLLTNGSSISYEEFKRLSKEYGKRIIQPMNDPLKEEKQELVQLLKDKLEPIQQMDEHLMGLAYVIEEYIGEELLDEESNERKRREIAAIQRCMKFNEERCGQKNILSENITNLSISLQKELSELNTSECIDEDTYKRFRQLYKGYKQMSKEEKSITSTQIGKATINAPIQDKVNARSVEPNTKEKGEVEKDDN